MNINRFFIFICLSLMVVFFFFKPMKLAENKKIDIAGVEVEKFSIHELNTKGLTRIIRGSKALIYKDTYKIIDVDYTDASRDNIANIKAKDGIYKDKTITLNGDVFFTRNDGLVLESQSLSYNEKTSILKTDDKYIMYRDKNKVIGTSFKLNNKLNKVYSKNVDITYDIGDN